jgi:dTMP kinase
MTSPSNAPEAGGPGPNGSSVAGRYYGRSIPYLPIDEYPGKLIAVEGTDGVGRSTQIQLLREWLEVRGYGVIETGWTRSPLMQPTIELAKSSNTLNKLTFVLLYATDFAEGGLHRALGSLHLHGARPRRCSRGRPSVAA